MTDAEIPGAIELLVGLLGLAAFVAIVVRGLRVPYTVALVIAGLLVGLAAGAAGFPPIDVSPDLVLLVLLPGLVFEAAYRLRITELRRWFGGLVLLAIPGVLISASHRRGRADARHRAAHRAVVHRRCHGVGHGSGGRRGHVQASPGATRPLDDGRWREPAQ